MDASGYIQAVERYARQAERELDKLYVLLTEENEADYLSPAEEDMTRLILCYKKAVRELCGEEMKHYVLGFYFTPDGVVLIEKVTPEWQQGLCNGLGGSIEPGETPLQAMTREFEEESGLATTDQDWRQTVVLTDPGRYQMHVFIGVGENAEGLVRENEEGTVGVYKELPDNMEQTARWLLLMLMENR